jgi:hypothetical protein
MRGLIAVPSRDSQPLRHEEFFESLEQLLRPKDWEYRQYRGDCISNHSQAVREMMADPDCQHIFFLDDDILLEPDALTRLLTHRRPAVSVNLLTRMLPWEPFNFKRISGKLMPLSLEGAPHLLKVDGCGLGGVLVERQVFERLTPPWFGHTETLKTDDLFLWKALEDAHIPLFVDLSICARHILHAYVKPVWDGHEWSTVIEMQGGGNLKLPPASPTPQYLAWLKAQAGDTTQV